MMPNATQSPTTARAASAPMSAGRGTGMAMIAITTTIIAGASG